MLAPSPSTAVAALAWIAAVTCITPARDAFAQQAEAAAEALFRAGRDASQRGDAATACDRFRESYRLEPALGTLLNIAMCELSLGQLSESWRHFQDVAHALPAGDSRVALANEQLAQLDKRLPRLTIHVAGGAPEGLSVWLGKVQLGQGSFGVALPMDPGSYSIEVRAPGHEEQRYEIALAEGERRSVDVAPGPALQGQGAVPAEGADFAARGAVSSRAVGPTSSTGDALDKRSATPATDPVREGERASKPEATARDASPTAGSSAAYALIGAGAFGVVVGAVCAVFVIDRLGTVQEECDGGVCSTPEGAEARGAGNALFYASVATLGAGVAVAGVGMYLLLSADAPAPIAARDSLPNARGPGRVLGAGVRLQF